MDDVAFCKQRDEIFPVPGELAIRFCQQGMCPVTFRWDARETLDVRVKRLDGVEPLIYDSLFKVMQCMM